MIKIIKNKISDAEMLAKAKNIPSLKSELQELIKISQEHEAKIRALRIRINDDADASQTGMVKEEVECSEKVNEEKLTMETIRNDTSEVIESRLLNQRELRNIKSSKKEA